MARANDDFIESALLVLEKTGLLVLDAHRVPLDIIRTASYLRKSFPNEKIVMPLAGYLFHVPIIAQLTKTWAKIERISLMPVYRKEELKPTTFWMSFFCKFYPKNLTDEMKRSRNHEYQEAAESLVHAKHSILLVAPYGGSYTLGEGVLKSGVVGLLKKCDYYCLSMCKVMSLRSPVFSEVYTNGENISDDNFFHLEFDSMNNREKQ